MWYALQKRKENHYLIYTDADLSTDLGQTGLLVDKFYNNNFHVAIGSRREYDSVVLKQGKRNDRGKLFIYLWKRMLPEIGYITDSQCGFKAFKADIATDIIQDTIEKKFAFDLELMLKAQHIRSECIAKVPVAWIDSESLSTTKTVSDETNKDAYLAMLKAVSRMYKHYCHRNEEGDSFSSLVDGLDESSWKSLLSNIPDSIRKKDPQDFSDFNQIKADDLIHDK
ncbi:MAG: hypothetical protein ACLFP2_00185 [Candidatus Woesearchaeota archaeon]